MWITSVLGARAGVLGMRTLLLLAFPAHSGRVLDNRCQTP